VGVQSRSSAVYHVDEVNNVLEIMQGLQNAMGYRHVGSVLGLAGIDASEDDENDFFDAQVPLDAPSGFLPPIPALRISKSVPAGFGIDDDIPDSDEDDDVKFLSTSSLRGPRDDRPPSF